MDMKNLCMCLAQCDKEAKVIKLLKNEGLWDDTSAWTLFGNKENNFATIGNQQSRPETALVEKIINSVDAMLMSECLKKGLNPEDANKVPVSINEALSDFFGIDSGKLSNITTTERRNIAENICLVATGAKANPCYTVIDKGEGQTPKMMPKTLLSIGDSNKLRIPFVQGRFNMGGTGVFRFCSKKNNLQLIISKRNPNIPRYENDETTNEWGFTLVKRENPSKRVKNSTYYYLAPSNRILSFESDSIKLLPGDYPN